MVLREVGVEKGMRSTMYQALRERRQEIEMFRAQRGMEPVSERGVNGQGRGVGTQGRQSNGSGIVGGGVVGKSGGSGGGGVVREDLVSLI